jgi:peroxiredoxin Q/BCP
MSGMHAFGFTFHRVWRLARVQIHRTTLFVLVAIWALSIGVLASAETPPVGAKVPDFAFLTPLGKAIRMSGLQQGHDLVLVVLRGFPGDQCPYCMRQVHDFVEHASSFAAKNTRILLVYPGPPAGLDQHANEFLAKQPELPSNVVLVTDPDYTVTNLYGLRWDALNETAHPSTFIFDKKGVIVFGKISHTHGDRMSAQDALGHLSAD